MNSPPHLQRLTLLRTTLEPFAQRLAAGRQTLHLPRAQGLRRQQPDLFFHAAPELFFQSAGHNRFTCPTEKFTLSPDEMAVMSRWLPHGEHCTAGPSGNFAAVVVGLDAGRATYRQLCLGGGARRSVAWSVAIDGAHSDRLGRYLDDLGACRNASPAFRDSLLLATLRLLLDLLLPAAAEEHTPPAHAFSPKVNRCREIIQAELSDPGLSVRHLARELRCTADHLSRLFRNECGVALNAFIREERLHQAQTLLADPSLNVSEVAWACGFRNPNYFIRRFRSAHGRTPGKARLG